MFKLFKLHVTSFITLSAILFGTLINPVMLNAETVTYSESKDPIVRLIDIQDYYASFNIDSSGTAYISGCINGKSGINDAYIKITLQKLSSTWNDVTYWEGYGGQNARIDETYDVSKGTYRLKVYCSAGCEAKMFTTNSQIY